MSIEPIASMLLEDYGEDPLQAPSGASLRALLETEAKSVPEAPHALLEDSRAVGILERGSRASRRPPRSKRLWLGESSDSVRDFEIVRESVQSPGADWAEVAALRGFRGLYGRPFFAPVVVVIPAYQEEDNIGTVVRSIPASSLGLGVTVLVVTDGCRDSTADVARSAGAFVCEVPVNRGQGAAFRLGYALAIEHGAQYIVTLDADGQYYPEEMDVLLAPVVAGDADLAQGSRRLGSAERDDPIRSLGVKFFGLVTSILLGQRITDSSNGFRAMRSAVPARVTLSENQYQSSEMLIGAVKSGFVYTERPTRMRKRLSGQSKKAKNLLYGLQYARVISKTWLRER